MKALTTSFLLAGPLLLAGLTGCTKREEPPAPLTPATHGSVHVRDGESVVSTGFAFEQGVNVNGKTEPGVVIVLTANANTTAPSAPNDELDVFFYKSPGASEYQLIKMVREQYSNLQYTTYSTDLVGTLTKTAQGTYTGSYSGTSPAAGTQPASTISKGQFLEITL